MKTAEELLTDFMDGHGFTEITDEAINVIVKAMKAYASQPAVGEGEIKKMILPKLNKVFEMGLKQSPFDAKNSEYYAPLIDLKIASNLAKAIASLRLKDDAPAVSDGAMIVNRVREILKGIDMEHHCNDIGWWSTSNMAEFGAGKLEELITYINESLNMQGEGEPPIVYTGTNYSIDKTGLSPQEKGGER